MTRGTTPTIKLTLTSGFDASDSTLYVTIKQHHAMLNVPSDEVEVDEDSTNIIYITLTQAETLEFTDGTAQIQVRGVKEDGTAWATSKATISIAGILREGELSYD